MMITVMMMMMTMLNKMSSCRAVSSRNCNCGLDSGNWIRKHMSLNARGLNPAMSVMLLFGLQLLSVLIFQFSMIEGR